MPNNKHSSKLKFGLLAEDYFLQAAAAQLKDHFPWVSVLERRSTAERCRVTKDTFSEVDAKITVDRCGKAPYSTLMDFKTTSDPKHKYSKHKAGWYGGTLLMSHACHNAMIRRDNSMLFVLFMGDGHPVIEVFDYCKLEQFGPEMIQGNSKHRVGFSDNARVDRMYVNTTAEFLSISKILL